MRYINPDGQQKLYQKGFKLKHNYYKTNLNLN